MPEIVARFLYPWVASLQGIDFVGRHPSGKVTIYTRLSDEEKKALLDEQARSGEPNPSTTLERLLTELLDDSRNGKKKIPVKATGRKVRPTTYKISPAVKERLDRLTGGSILSRQMLIRAAIARTVKP